MLRNLALFSKTIAKYAYYPMLIGVISVLSAFLYDSVFSLIVACICAVLCIAALLKDPLCRRAGIDPKIR